MKEPSRDELLVVFNCLIRRCADLQEQALRNKHNHFCHLLERSDFQGALAFIEQLAREAEELAVIVERERYRDANLDDVIQEMEEQQRMESLKQEWLQLLANGVPVDQLPLDPGLPLLAQLYERAQLDPTGVLMQEYQELKRKWEEYGL